MSRPILRAGAAAAALAALAVAAPAAGAHMTQLRGGTTELTLSRQAENALVRAGIVPGRLVLPVRSGAIELGGGGGEGRIDHGGTIVLRSRTARVALHRVRIDNGPRAGRLSAVLRGTRLTLASIGYRGASTDHDNADVSGLRLTLTGPAARALNAAFGTAAFRPGLPLGQVDVDGVERNVVTRYSRGESTIVLDTALTASLAAKGAALTALAPATGAGTAASPFSLALTRGTGQITAPDTYELAGGLVLTLGATTLALSDPQVEIGHHGAHVTADSPFGPLQVFELDLSEVDSTGRHGTVALSGIRLLPGANLAALLAPVLGATRAEAAKLVVGTATLSAGR